MRLQLTLLLAVGRAAHAEPLDGPGAGAGLHVYTDDDHVTVVSPSASVRLDATPRLSVAAETVVDAVTAASVDVVTSASPHTVSEQRVELGLTGTYRQGRATWWTLGANGSHEHDYDALRLRTGGRTEVAQRNTTLQLDYVFGLDHATSRMDPSFARGRSSHELLLGASQLLSRRAVIDAVADLTRADGYHASPYREVLVDVPGSPLPMRLSEATPALRSSIAFALRARYAPGERWSTSATYRYYADTWSVRSHTLSAEVHRGLGDWLVGLALRAYTQTAASFYAPRYTGEPRYRTRDRTLGAMQSAYAAATLEAPIGDWHVIASAGVLRLVFADFPAQADRNALLVFSSVVRTW